jgi:transcription elongation factor Elf1
MPSIKKYKRVFECGNKKCDGDLIPLKVTKNKKGGNVLVLGRCPECKKKFEFPVSSSKEEINKWGLILHKRMFYCSFCGKKALKLYHREGYIDKGYLMEFTCKNCGKKGKRFVEASMFHFVSNELLDML